MLRCPVALSLWIALADAQEPVPAPAPAPAAAPVDFTRQIAPLLLQRCVECHGPHKQEGDLRLDQRALVFPDGKNDEWVVQPGKPDDSELLRRVLLPVGDDDVMPAKGEPLTQAQQALLRQWIAEGAEWPATGDAVFAAAAAAREAARIRFELPVVDAAQQAAIAGALRELRQLGATAQVVAADTAAVEVNLSLLRDKVTDRELALLQPLAPVLVWLNLSRTAVSDAGLAVLAQCQQLRRLHLNNTVTSDAGLAHLAALARLEYLNLYGTKVTDQGLQHLHGLPKLRQLYVWQTAVTAQGAELLRAQQPDLRIDRGEYVEERQAAAEREIAQRKADEERKAAAAKEAPINDKCPVSGAAVDPAHVVVHDGKRIGFCCDKCQAKFVADPAAFRVEPKAAK